MLRCAECGKDNPDERSICWSCGAELATRNELTAAKPDEPTRVVDAGVGPPDPDDWGVAWTPEAIDEVANQNPPTG